MRHPHLLLAALLAVTPAPASAQGAGAPPSAALMERARSTDEAVVFYLTLGELIRRSYTDAEMAARLPDFMGELASGPDPVKRAVTVDAVRSLPDALQARLVPRLSQLARQAPDGPATRLYVRGLGEAGPAGRTALQALLTDGRLTGDARALAQRYLRR